MKVLPPTNEWEEVKIQRRITVTEMAKETVHEKSNGMWLRARIAPALIEQMHQAVKFGMKVLDDRLPGWEFELNIEELNLGDASLCVCGQLFADKVELTDAFDNPPDGYEWAVRNVIEDYFHHAFPENGESDNYRQASRLGFALPGNMDDDQQTHESHQLQIYRGEIHPQTEIYWTHVEEWNWHVLYTMTGWWPRLPSLWEYLTDLWTYEIVERRNAAVNV